MNNRGNESHRFAPPSCVPQRPEKLSETSKQLKQLNSTRSKTNIDNPFNFPYEAFLGFVRLRRGSDPYEAPLGFVGLGTRVQPCKAPPSLPELSTTSSKAAATKHAEVRWQCWLSVAHYKPTMGQKDHDEALQRIVKGFLRSLSGPY